MLHNVLNKRHKNKRVAAFFNRRSTVAEEIMSNFQSVGQDQNSEEMTTEQPSSFASYRANMKARRRRQSDVQRSLRLYRLTAAGFIVGSKSKESNAVNLFNQRHEILTLERQQRAIQLDHRLQDRVKELLELNLDLEREVYLFNEREVDAKSRIASLDLQLGELKTKFEKLRVENSDRQQDFCGLQEKYLTEKEAREIIQINYEEKVKECRDLYKSVSRLQTICSEQEKSIDRLKGLVNSVQLCDKLLNRVKRSAWHNVKDVPHNEDSDLQNFVIEYEVKLQGYNRRKENFSRCLQSLGNVFEEHVNQSHSCKSDKETYQENNKKLEVACGKRAEAFTCLLDETGRYIAPEYSTVEHKPDYEIVGKDENFNQLQNDLQECKKELAIERDMLPKMTDEIDKLWKEMKQYDEQNVLLNLGINALKKKVEKLDEDILSNEGQITNLQNSTFLENF